MDDSINTVFSDSLGIKNITRIIVNANKDSEVITEMKSADNYFNGKNEVILNKTRNYYDKDGKSFENPKANNAKIKSNFLRMLVEQKQNYGFSKSFIFKLSDENGEDVDLSVNEYGMEWKKFLDEKLFKFVLRLAGQAINRGIAWCYIWLDENGELQLKDVPATMIYPIWLDEQHINLDRLVYHYHIQKYDSDNPTDIEYAEYWSKRERVLFNVTDDYTEIPIQITEDKIIIRSHMMNEKGEAFSWDKVPFVAFKGTDDEKTLLSFIKEQIDNYDKLSSGSVDSLVDELDPLLVLKGISSDIADIVEARELIRMTRTMSLESDGDAKFIQAQIEIDSHLKQLESLRRDIIKFGYGVDFEDARFNGNPNQMVIKSLYQNMDTYTNGLERRFQDFIDNLKYFFDKWCEFTGRASFEDCQRYKALVTLDRSMMFNTSAQIQDCKILGETGISKKTQLENNPVVQDVDVELQRIKEEEEEAEKKQKEMMEEMYNFKNVNNDNSDEEDEEIIEKEEIKNKNKKSK